MKYKFNVHEQHLNKSELNFIYVFYICYWQGDTRFFKERNFYMNLFNIYLKLVVRLSGLCNLLMVPTCGEKNPAFF